MRTFILSIASLLVFTGLAQASAHPDFFGVVKIESYFQTGTNTVTLETFDMFGHGPYEFEAFYEESSGESVSSVGFLTSSVEVSLFRHPDGVWELPDQITHHFATKAEMDLAFPNLDSYIFFIDTSLVGPPLSASALTSASFTFGLTENYFVAPQLSNTGFIDGVLKFDFTQNFLFTWDTPSGFPFVNGSDHVLLFIEEIVPNGGFSEVVDEAWNFPQSSFLLPGGTLDPLQMYDLELIFANVVGDIDFNIPGHAGVAAFVTGTGVELMHVPEPGTYGLIFGLAALGFVLLRRRRP